MILGRVIRDSFPYLASHVLGIGAGLVVLPLLLRALPPEQIGVYDLIQILWVFLNLIIPLEISQSLGRFYPDPANSGRKNDIFSTTLYYALLSFGISLFLAFLCTPLLRSDSAGHASQRPTFLLASIGLTTTGIYYILQVALRASLRPYGLLLANVVYFLVYVSVSMTGIYVLHMNINAILLSQILAHLSAIVLALYCSRKDIVFRFDSALLKELLSYSLPFVSASSCANLASYADRFLITGSSSLEALAVYGVAFRVASAITVVFLALQSPLMPLIYAHYGKPDVRLEIARLMRLCLFLTLSLMLTLFLLARPIVLLLGTSRYAAAIPVAQILLPSIAIQGMYFFAPGLFIAKKTWVIALIHFSSALITYVIGFLLFPVWSLSGVAVGSLCGAVTLTSAYYYLGHKYYPIPYAWVPIVLSSGGFCMIISIAHFVPTDHPTGLIIRFIMALAGPFVFSAMGLVNRKDIRAVLRLDVSPQRTD